MKQTMQLFLLAACVLAAPVIAAGPAVLPPDLPPYAPDKPLPVPQIERRTLDNGLDVWVVPRDGVPRVDYVLAMRDAGHGADPADAPGFAALLSEGTARRDARAIAEAAQSYGGGVAASASNDGVLVSANALTSHAAPMLSLLAEIVREPAFPDNEVALGKANALQSLRAA